MCTQCTLNVFNIELEPIQHRWSRHIPHLMHSLRCVGWSSDCAHTDDPVGRVSAWHQCHCSQTWGEIQGKIENACTLELCHRILSHSRVFTLCPVASSGCDTVSYRTLRLRHCVLSHHQIVTLCHIAPLSCETVFYRTLRLWYSVLSHPQVVTPCPIAPSCCNAVSYRTLRLWHGVLSHC